MGRRTTTVYAVPSPAKATDSMQRVLLPLLISLTACADFAGKGDKPEGQEAESDADADSDADTDTDSDTDTDTDTDDRTVSGQTLCAGGGLASDGAHTAVTCIGPTEVALTTEASDGTHTLQAGPICG